MRSTFTAYLLLILWQIHLDGQQRIYVLPSASGNGDGTSWENAYTDLHPALEASGSGDELWIAGGTYYPSNDDDRNATFTIQSGQKWYGGFQGTESLEEQRLISRYPTILSGNIGDTSVMTDNVYTVITAKNTNASTLLNGIDITGGYADGGDPDNPNDVLSSGGGMHISTIGSQMGVSMIYVDFIDNYAQGYGGAIAFTSSKNSMTAFSINTCFFQNNVALSGGNAVFAENLNRGNLSQIVDTQFRNNQPKNVSQELLFHFKGVEQGVLLNRNIAGNIRNGIGNGFVRIVNSAQGTEVMIWENQLFSSNLEYGYDIIQEEGDMEVNLLGEDIEEITQGENKESAIIRTQNPDNFPLEIYCSGATYMHNNVSYLLKSDDADSILMSGLIVSENEFKNAGIEINSLNQCRFEFHNNIYSNNIGVAIDLNGDGNQHHASGIVHSTFRNNLLPDAHPEYEPDELALIIIQGNDEQQLSLVNNIFYHNENIDFRTAVLKGGQLEMANNVLPFSTCNDNVVVIDGDLTCDNNLFQVNPFFASDDPIDVTLAPCSPCIDAGENSANLIFGYENDFYGNDRIINDLTDIGASEFLDEREKSICLLESEMPDFSAYGLPPFVFQWIDQEGESGEMIDNLLPGKYNLTITDSWGCAYLTALTISPDNGLQFIHHDKDQDIHLCQEEKLVLAVPEYYEVVWPDGSSISSFTVDRSGEYQVQLSDGCVSESVSLSVETRVASLQDTTYILCENDTLWLDDRAIIAEGTFSDTIKSSGGCDSLITTYTVIEEEKGTVGFTGETMICPDEETLINIEGGQAYLWPDDNKGQQQWLTFGNYQVEVIDSNGCLHVLDIAIDTFAFAFTPLPSNITKGRNEELILDLEDQPGLKITEVIPSDHVSWTVNSLTVLPPASGTYTVKMEDPAGCLREWEIYIDAVESNINEAMMVSNIITPDDDGINDVQLIHSFSGLQLDQMMIYDRWGGKVFFKKFSDVQLVYQGWNGKIENETAPPGIYIWVIIYEMEGVKNYQSGDVTIIR